MTQVLPRLLIIDDLFGRSLPDRRNEERFNLCGQYLLEDITGDEVGKGSTQRLRAPFAEAVFCRGQIPAAAKIGDTVENSIDTIVEVVRGGWDRRALDSPPWTMVLLDLCFYTGLVTTESHDRVQGMPGGRAKDDDPRHFFGLTVLRTLRAEFPDLPVVIFSSKSRTDVSREFAAGGALGFLDRGDGASRDVLKQYVARHGLLPDDAGEIVGLSIPLLLALRAGRRAAENPQHILIRGERGTGKELMARYIHRHSANRRGRLVVVDSGTLSPTLYASELFGHMRGAFTGADRDRRGRVIEADGGDLFLDEIGNMPVDVQAGLLRVVEQHEVVPLGATDGRKVDVRVISATNEDLARSVTEGTFRADLLDRLCQGATITLPSLDERKSDIPLLVRRFVREAEKAYGAMRRNIDGVAVEKLQATTWPGNVREIKAAIFSAVSEHRDVEHLDESHLRLAAGGRLIAPLLTANLQSGGSVGAVLAVMSTFDFNALSPSQLLGQLPSLDHAYAVMLAHYLSSALRAHLRHTPESPQGKLMIQPALVMITGDSALAATKAYDLVIRFRHLSASADALWESDPLLKEAYEKAVAKRRSQRSPSSSAIVSRDRLAGTHKSKR